MEMRVSRRGKGTWSARFLVPSSCLVLKGKVLEGRIRLGSCSVSHEHGEGEITIIPLGLGLTRSRST